MVPKSIPTIKSSYMMLKGIEDLSERKVASALDDKDRMASREGGGLI